MMWKRRLVGHRTTFFDGLAQRGFVVTTLGAGLYRVVLRPVHDQDDYAEHGVRESV